MLFYWGKVSGYLFLHPTDKQPHLEILTGLRPAKAYAFCLQGSASERFMSQLPKFMSGLDTKDNVKVRRHLLNPAVLPVNHLKACVLQNTFGV